MKTTSRFAVATAAGLFMGGIALTPAQAADLGGDCCADLEERVAELEATTVRKGNRKVSVKISGQVSEALMIWDDGQESNSAVVDLTSASSRINVTGSASIKPGWSAGFRIVYEADLSGFSSSNTSQRVDEHGGDPGFDVREVSWHIKSDKLGMLEVGQHQPATDNLILYDLGSTGLGAVNAVNFIGGALFVRQAGSVLTGVNSPLLTVTGFAGAAGNGIGSATLATFTTGLDTSRRQGVMYYTPEVAGFQLLTSWGMDDTWDIALRFKKQWNSIRFIAGIGYLDEHDESDNKASDPGIPADGETEIHEWKGSASILHEPSGLFVTGAIFNREYDGTRRNELTVLGTQRPDTDYWYIEAGVYRRFNSLGKTAFYGEYFEAEDAITGLATTAGAGGNPVNTFAILTDSEMQGWGVGVNQKIDAAAMEIFAAFRHFEFDISGRDQLGPGPVRSGNLEDLDIFYTGARIRF